MQDYAEYLNKIKFDDYLKTLKRKLKNKKIIIYGCGAVFTYIKNNKDLSGLNIIGVSDIKFSKEQKGNEYLGYKIIPKDSILEYKPDYILVSSMKYEGIINDFENNILKDNKNIKVVPLLRIRLSDLIKRIFKF